MNAWMKVAGALAGILGLAKRTPPRADTTAPKPMPRTLASVLDGGWTRPARRRQRLSAFAHQRLAYGANIRRAVVNRPSW